MAAPNEENILNPFCPEKVQRKRNDPNGGRWSLRYPTIAHSKAALRFVTLRQVASVQAITFGREAASRN